MRTQKQRPKQKPEAVEDRSKEYELRFLKYNPQAMREKQLRDIQSRREEIERGIQVKQTLSIAFIGGCSGNPVGKSSIISTYFEEPFLKNRSAYNAEFFRQKKVDLGGYGVALRCYDFSCQDLLKAKMFFSRIDVFVLVLDAREDFEYGCVAEAGRSWLERVIELGGEGKPVYVAAGHLDVASIDNPDSKKFNANSSHYAKPFSVHYLSAKTGEGVNDLFSKITRDSLPLPSMKIEVESKPVEQKENDGVRSNDGNLFTRVFSLN